MAASPKKIKSKLSPTPAADGLKKAKKSRKSKIPADIKPMLATLVDQAFDEPGWIYEVKWDGYRALAYLDGQSVEIRSRNNKSFTQKFYPIYQALQQWNVRAVVDGEIIVVNEKGVADFGDLQNWRSEADGQLNYCVFDLLWLDGMDTMGLPLDRRKELLQAIIPPQGVIKASQHFDAGGRKFFELAARMGLEGIMAKKATSVYTPDLRSKEWLKIKTEKRQEVVIAGYTRNEHSPKPFSALLLGLHEGGTLRFIGPVGTGFSTKVQQDILEKLKPLITPQCPFDEVPDYNKPSRFRPDPPKASVTWVKPRLVAEISYRELTRDGSIRHPSFKGLREDKRAKDVRRENAGPVADMIREHTTLREKKMIATPGTKERKTFLNPQDETQTRDIDGHEIKFTNLSKVFWPGEGFTKRDMLNYYYQVAPILLPYLKDRPQSLNRHPHGIDGKSFYQKNVTGKVPGWIQTFPYYSETDHEQKNFLVCSDEASILYIASLGCIEINPWHSRAASPDHPDWCIIDLDPDKNTFEQVIEAARITKKILDALGVVSVCKTSGSTGLHIYIPLGAKYTYHASREFARKIATLVHREIPSFTSIERLTANRKGKMYIDFLQNRPQATVAAPYSLRPRPGAPVSMPLHWEEVKKGLKPGQFTITNAVARIKEQGDLFKPVIGKAISLKQAEAKAASL